MLEYLIIQDLNKASEMFSCCFFGGSCSKWKCELNFNVHCKMSSFFDDIITPSSLNQIKKVNENFDSFSMGMRQMANFQLLLYDSLNDLAAKYTALRTEVSYLNSQLLNIDEAVTSYLEKNPVTVYTRDGMPMDDAIAILQEKIVNLSDRLKKTNENNENLTHMIHNNVTKEEFKSLSSEINKNTQTTNDMAFAIEMLQKEAKDQRDALDNKWGVVHDIFKTEIAEYNLILDQKASQDDLDNYVTHDDLTEICDLFRQVPMEKRSRIPEIIPQIMQDTALTMEEKIRRAYELLSVERKRVDGEDAALKKEFQDLRQLANDSKAIDEKGELGQGDYVEEELRDIGTNDGIAEPEDIKFDRVKKFSKRQNIATNFDGPENCLCEGDINFDEMIMQMDEVVNASNGPPVEVNTQQIVTKVLIECQGFIDRQLSLLMSALGAQVDPTDVSTLVKQLKVLEELKMDMNSLKVKLPIKVDQSVMYDELKNYMTREEFFDKVGNSDGFDDMSMRSSLPKMHGATSRSPQKTIASGTSSVSGKKSKTKERKAPIPLRPARSPIMTVNEKFMKGNDNKLYLRDIQTFDKNYKEPSVTGSTSYYNRSKRSSLEGIDAIVDFQPYIPVDEDTGGEMKIEIQQFDFDQK